MDDVLIRVAAPRDADRIAEVWRHGWREAHPGAVPEALVAARTEESFTVRAGANLARSAVAVAVADGELAGFVTVARDEVEQLYLAPEHRGGAIAATLLAEGERRITATRPHGRLARRRRGERPCTPLPRAAGVVRRGSVRHDAPGGIVVPAHRYVRVIGAAR